MLKTPAFQLLIEFLTNIARQHPALGCPLRLKSRVVFFDKLVKKGLLHAMALISRRTLPAAGLPASWQLPGWFSWVKFTWTAEKNGETADNVSRRNVNRDDYGQNA
jgi:hypothetical protein